MVVQLSTWTENAAQFLEVFIRLEQSELIDEKLTRGDPCREHILFDWVIYTMSTVLASKEKVCVAIWPTVEDHGSSARELYPLELMK